MTALRNWPWLEAVDAAPLMSPRPAPRCLPQAITAFLWGPLCPLLVYGIFNAKPWRYTLMVIVSVGQIYGDVLYYGTCYLEGASRGRAWSTHLQQAAVRGHASTRHLTAC